jgi:hypothetical protein
LTCGFDYGLGDIKISTVTNYQGCAASCEASGLTGAYGTACIGFAYFPDRYAEQCYTYSHYSSAPYDVTSETFMNGLFAPYNATLYAAKEAAWVY